VRPGRKSRDLSQTQVYPVRSNRSCRQKCRSDTAKEIEMWGGDEWVGKIVL